MTLRRVEAIWEYPVQIEQAKANCRVDADDDTVLLFDLIKAATARAERETGMVFCAQTWALSLDAFPDGEITIQMGPLTAITSVEYMDEDGETQTVDPSAYRVDTVSRDGRVIPVDEWPEAGDYPNAVTVTFTVGGECPQDVQQAILLMVGHWYANREAASEKALQAIPLGAGALLDLHRRMFV